MLVGLEKKMSVFCPYPLCDYCWNKPIPLRISIQRFYTERYVYPHCDFQKMCACIVLANCLPRWKSFCLFISRHIVLSLISLMARQIFTDSAIVKTMVIKSRFNDIFFLKNINFLSTFLDQHIWILYPKSIMWGHKPS